MNVNAIDAVRTEEVNVNLTERGFLAYKRKVSNTFNPPRAPNAFELATAKALWRATMQALNGSVKGKHISVSAATGSGKSMGAVALLAYFPSKGCERQCSSSKSTGLVRSMTGWRRSFQRGQSQHGIASIGLMRPPARRPSSLRARRLS